MHLCLGWVISSAIKTKFFILFQINFINFFFVLQSKYKSLLISEKTTVDELIQMLLNCYNSSERVEQFSLYEVCEGEEYQRKLHPDDSPLKVTLRWTSVDRHLRIRRNPDYNPHRRRVFFFSFLRWWIIIFSFSSFSIMSFFKNYRCHSYKIISGRDLYL